MNEGKGGDNSTGIEKEFKVVLIVTNLNGEVKNGDEVGAQSG